MTRSRVLFPPLPLPSRTGHSLESVIGIYYKLISYFISGFVSAASEIMKKLFYGHIRFLRWWWAAEQEEEEEVEEDKEEGAETARTFLGLAALASVLPRPIEPEVTY